MTLAPLSGSFRPGAPTTPQPVAGSGSGSPEAYQLQFLSAEERSTAVLMGYFQDARLELENFIRTGDLTMADATYYRKLLDETSRIGSKLNAQGATWVTNTIPEAYSAGWRQNSSVVVPQKALEALSRDTLSLISQTTNGIRQTVRQAIAQGILQGLPGDQVRARILASGLTNIPRWPNVEYRAGVIARTETMRSYNAGHMDAMIENGARYVEWIASPDEAVCSICGPRDGKIFRIGPADTSGPADAIEEGLTKAEREEIVGYPGFNINGVVDPPDPNYVGEGYGLKRGAEERLAQYATMPYNPDGKVASWEVHAVNGDMTRAKAGIRNGWLDGASTPESTMLQSALKDVGLDGNGRSMVWSRGLATLQPSDAARTATRAVYADTQAALASGPSTITVYRGVKSDTATRNVLESWSTEYDFAKRFDGHAVLKAEVPREAVFMDLREATQFESEMTVIGGRIPNGAIETLPGTGGTNPVGPGAFDGTP